MLDKKLRKIKQHFDKLDFKIHSWLSKWIITLFIYNFSLTA